jgi:hypothetical protein
MLVTEIDELFENKAKTDGSYAIAYAILQLAGAQDRAASALYALGNGNASTHTGAIESLAHEIKGVATAIMAVADSRSN